jgi:selenocysteine lyase/cysteine desulfurase
VSTALLECQRSLFDIPDGITYLNCGYQGPQLRQSTKSAIEQLKRKSQPWTITPDDFFSPAEKLREQFAALIDASPGDIAIVPSISYAMATAAANLPVGQHRHTVMLAEQFPSHVYTWREHGNRHARITTVNRPLDSDWTSDIIEAIDTGCSIAALPGAHWTDGYQLDLDKIGQHCQSNGTALVLDLTQSLGAVPFSVRDVEADFVATSIYKWMLGPPGLCLMYVNPRHQLGRPIELNWISRKNSEDFAGLTDYTNEFQAGARRFDAGGRANLVNMAIAGTALQQIHSWGVENISAYTKKLTDLAAGMAVERGLEYTPDAYRSPHIIGISLPVNAAREIADQLHQRQVYVSLRGNKLRIAPHLYNTPSDIERLFTVMDEFLS